MLVHATVGDVATACPLFFSVSSRAKELSWLDRLDMFDIELASNPVIVDITKIGEYEDYLQRCLAGPFRRYKKRTEYLRNAIPRGFHKKLLIFDKEVVGQIEYSPAEVSYYPIMGDNTVVMNCIWVLKKAKGHDFGKLLLDDLVKTEKDASGFATIALENHWSPWFKKEEIKKLGFKSLDSIKVTHKIKYKGRVFKIHLMWIPTTEKSKLPTWNQQKLLEGITTCVLHPLYNPQTYEPKQILKKS